MNLDNEIDNNVNDLDDELNNSEDNVEELDLDEISEIINY